MLRKLAIWIAELLYQLRYTDKAECLNIHLYCDNEAAIEHTKNLVFHTKARDIDVACSCAFCKGAG